MFAFFSRLWTRKRSDNPLEGWGTSYVSLLKPQLDRIAAALSDGRVVRTRFNRDPTHGELYSLDGTVIAQIKVHGECGAPYVAIVKSSLSDAAKALFVQILPVRVEFEAFA